MNDIAKIVASQIQRGMSPNAILSQMAHRDYRVAQVLEITRGKSNEEMRRYAENLARERGLDLDSFVRSLGISVSSNR